MYEVWIRVFYCCQLYKTRIEIFILYLRCTIILKPFHNHITLSMFYEIAPRSAIVSSLFAAVSVVAENDVYKPQTNNPS